MVTGNTQNGIEQDSDSDDPTADYGGGNLGSPGNNTITGNGDGVTYFHFYNDHPEDVYADDDHRTGSLADDLTDIYCELKNGLKLVDGEPERAMEDWHKGYHLHWGQHLVDAERHLYELRVRNQLLR